MMLKPCGCSASRLSRIRRPFWMRLIPLARLYYCYGCNERVLRFGEPGPVGSVAAQQG